MAKRPRNATKYNFHCISYHRMTFDYVSGEQGRVPCSTTVSEKTLVFVLRCSQRPCCSSSSDGEDSTHHSSTNNICEQTVREEKLKTVLYCFYSHKALKLIGARRALRIMSKCTVLVQFDMYLLGSSHSAQSCVDTCCA